MRQKRARNWEKYDVEELRGKTMGIVGYGDIGRACAKLAHIYGMRIVALRRNPALCAGDPLCDAIYGADKDSLNRLMAESGYVVCSAPPPWRPRGWWTWRRSRRPSGASCSSTWDGGRWLTRMR